MFGRVLVANRGEIAVRVIRACRELAHRADRRLLRCGRARAAHVARRPRGSRRRRRAGRELPVDRRGAGRGARHQGRRRASRLRLPVRERRVCRRVRDGGHRLHRAQPRGHDARRLEDQRAGHWPSAPGVPVIPGEAPADQGDEALQAAADRIGFPVLLKPSAGGGGIGMKVVTAAAGLADAAAQARREAAAAFGDPTLYLERLIERAAPRRVPDRGGPPRPRGPRVRARVLTAAAPSEGGGGVALGGADAGAAGAHGRRGGPRGEGRRLYRRGHGRVSGRGLGRRRAVLFPGGECAAPGGAPDHRDGRRRGPGPGADPGGRGRAAAVGAGAARAARARHRGAPLRRGPAAGVPAAGGTRRAVPRALDAGRARGCRRRRGQRRVGPLRPAARQAHRLGRDARCGAAARAGGAERVPDSRSAHQPAAAAPHPGAPAIRGRRPGHAFPGAGARCADRCAAGGRGHRGDCATRSHAPSAVDPKRARHRDPPTLDPWDRIAPFDV